MGKLLTIVIPAYNSQEYMGRCLDSLIVSEELMSKVQVLVVNDGSKDKTSEIAHDYESRFPGYFNVIDKDNGNYGSCMNVGLKKAEGKYFRTLDSDDWYDKDAYEDFLNVLENTEADMLVCEKQVYMEETSTIIHQKFGEGIKTDTDLTTAECREYWNRPDVNTALFVASVSYKTSLLREVGMKWDEGVFYTDNEYVYWPMYKVRTVRFVPCPAYVYLKGRADQSVSPQVERRNFHSCEVVANRILDDFLVHANSKGDMYDAQKKIMVGDVMRQFYRQLLISEKSVVDKVKAVDDKLKPMTDIYNEVENLGSYYRIKYIKEFRNNSWKLGLARLIFKLKN